MTTEKLRTYDGKSGKKAYVAYKGKVYDVTQSRLWKDGIHKRIHQAGMDLTEAMASAPHAEEVFEKFTVVDTLEETNNHKKNFAIWYRKFHPHPMLVHFPIALHLFASGFDLIFFVSPKPSFATAIFYTFFVATIMGALAMIPGILSWWVNYNLAFTKIFIIKLSVSILTLLLGVVGIMIYLKNPDIVYTTTMPSILYHGIILFTGFAVIVLGYYGGKITWPDE